MMNVDIDALERLAKAATPGPWEIGYRDDLVFSEQGAQISYSATITSSEEEHCISAKQAAKNTAFIAAANPAAILELIAELRQARAERDWLAEHRPARYCPTVETWETCLVDVPGHKLPKACIQCWIDRAKEAVCQMQNSEKK